MKSRTALLFAVLVGGLFCGWNIGCNEPQAPATQPASAPTAGASASNGDARATGGVFASDPTTADK